MATNLTTEVQEVDSSFSTQQIYYEEFRTELEHLLEATAKFTQSNTEFVEHVVKLTKEMESLESYERKTSPEVSDILAKLRDVELGVADLQQNRVRNETEMFEDSLKDHYGFALSAQRLLKNRQNALRDYQIAQANTKSKQEKSTEGEEALANATKAKEHEDQQQKNFEDLTANVTEQLKNYNAEKSKQMRVALRELARENIEFGEQSIALWKDLGKAVEEL